VLAGLEAQEPKKQLKDRVMQGTRHEMFRRRKLGPFGRTRHGPLRRTRHGVVGRRKHWPFTRRKHWPFDMRRYVVHLETYVNAYGFLFESLQSIHGMGHLDFRLQSKVVKIVRP
ncbi:hypothetical protein Tco_1098609, partial [Tanacetum coccineum]